MRKMLYSVFASALLATASVSVAKTPAPQAAHFAPPPHGKGRFVGSHPLAARPGAGYCYIDVPHVHDYLPDRPALYQQAGDGVVFTGDPVPFGYEGQKTVFYGHHPITIEVEPTAAGPAPTFCFMKGPHYHDYPQPEGPGFKLQDNVVFYVGPIPPPVAAIRPQLEQALEVEYRPYVAQRPKVVVTPPPEWAGVVWVAPPAPAVVVAPAPAPAIVVAPTAPTVVVAPPAPTVVVAPPRPSAVIIGVPPPVIMMHGKGKGWKHHGRGNGWGWGGKGHWKH